MSSGLEKLYDKCPPFIQNLMVTGYGFKIYRREYGRVFHSVLEEFKERQWWSPERLRAYQDEKLKKLIRHSYENVPYYKSKMNETGMLEIDG